MGPPSKRLKRNISSISSAPTQSNDDDQRRSPTPDPITSPTGNTPKPSSKRRTQTVLSSRPNPKAAPLTLPKAKTAHFPPNAAPIHLPNSPGRRSKSTSLSPEKSKGKQRRPETVKSGSIYSFFSAQTQKERRETAPAQGTQDNNSERDDIISDDDEVADIQAQRGSVIGQAARKRGSLIASGGTDVVSGSQKFLKPSLPPDPDSVGVRPWADRFAPVSLDELAVHKKKVADVRTWLESALEGRIRQRILVLKGSAGTGKTTTVQLLAKDLECDLIEWRNPVGSVSSADGFVSFGAQFDDFVTRGGRFGQLDVIPDAPTTAKPITKPLDRRKSLILVEEFPNTFTRSSSTLQSFRSAILQYLARNTPSLAMMYNSLGKTDAVAPLILVISETLLTTTSASADSFTAHRLLGPEILQHPGVAVIEFNAIAPTLLQKALELVVVKESRKTGRRKTPGPQVLKRLGEVGDIRSAIGSLEFLCLRGDDEDWGAKVSFGRGVKCSKDVALTKMEQESLELVTRREASLGIFHAVGKVMYNKRSGNAGETLPTYLQNYARPQKSEVKIDDLMDETGTDVQTFVAALHENYPMSCDAPPSSFEFTDMDHVNGCIDALSDSDLLSPSWEGLASSGYGGSAGDLLRQNELSFQTATRGILFSLPCPVKRRAPAADGLRAGKGGDAFKMFYPTSMKLWRMKEEIESSLDLWIARLLNGDTNDHITAGATAFSRTKPGSVESWKSNRNSAENAAAPLFAIGASAKKEILLERLPFVAAISRSKGHATREIERITSFTGIGRSAEEEEEGEDGEAATINWATDKPADGKSPQKKLKVRRVERHGLEAHLAAQQLEQKLVISDDDIEDF